NRWLASGSLIKGRVKVDEGASKALKKRNSLLAVGISEIAGEFSQGEVFEIVDEEDNIIAVAKSKLSSAELNHKLKTRNLEVAHANDIVLIKYVDICVIKLKHKVNS